MSSHYGTVGEANTYFETKLHTTAWDDASASEKEKALFEATRAIDRLAFKGYKNTTYLLLLSNEDATDEEIREANLEQELAFPRDADTTVPEEIEIAAYEIAYELLDGVEPQKELENLGVLSHHYGNAVRTNYSEERFRFVQHLVHGIPSVYAWRLLKPYLTVTNFVQLFRCD